MTPDVNLLVAASRAEHKHHAQAREWLLNACEQSASNGFSMGQINTPLRLIPIVIASFLRLVTNPRVFARPTQTEQAIEFLDALLACPGVGILDPISTWPILRQMCLEKKLSANAIPDALIAAAVLQSNDMLVTFDRDFLRLLPPHQLQLLLPENL